MVFIYDSTSLTQLKEISSGSKLIYTVAIVGGSPNPDYDQQGLVWVACTSTIQIRNATVCISNSVIFIFSDHNLSTPRPLPPQLNKLQLIVHVSNLQSIIIWTYILIVNNMYNRMLYVNQVVL